MLSLFKKLSLYQRLSTSLLVVFVCVVLAFVWSSQKLDELTKDQAEQELHSDLATHLVHDNPLLSSGQLNDKSLKNLFHSMMILGPNFEFYVLDQQGKILTYSAKPELVIRKNIDIQPITQYLEEPKSLPVYAEDPRSDGKKIFSAAVIKNKGDAIGYLYVIVRSQIYEGIFAKAQQNGQVRLYALFSVTSFIFLFAILLLIFRFLVNPLRKLTNQVKAIKQDGFNETLATIPIPKSAKEVEQLTYAFNQMIEQINLQFNSLKSVDVERRELLAHLSHDLRTPLASLQGFLETIALQNNSLSETDRANFLERCLKSSRQLKGFVDQIFELAHLESGQVSITLEPLPIAELLYDLVEKFSLKASKKGVLLSVDLEHENVQIITDIAKLERVLSNLIENALRHTPKGGKVSLKLVNLHHPKQVRVVVEDSGNGILPKELPYLFEPRYRGSQSAEDEQRHIGFGLTISRKLLTLMGSEIKAANNQKIGANFSFCLPCA
jgi:signal transduction histidine kinase/uncharacterized membrane protein